MTQVTLNVVNGFTGAGLGGKAKAGGRAVVSKTINVID
jgi:hypothetical protein